MTRVVRLLGSLQIAVPLLVAIAAVLAWGTMYETKFGTAAVQRTVYQSWWFQTILGFLALNLAVAAFERFPWKRHQTPFVLAHLGIILILLGGIIGGHFGIEGQLIIPEGQAENVLQLSRNVLVIRHPLSKTTQVVPTDFETRAWVHEPRKTILVPAPVAQTLRLTVDRYYPDAQLHEEIVSDGQEDFPAVHVRLAHESQEDDFWLMSKDPERFGMSWGEAHVLFLEPKDAKQLAQWMGPATRPSHPRGVVSVRIAKVGGNHEIPVPDTLGKPLPIQGTPYSITFKEYFPDFLLTEHGLTNRSADPNNPAVALILTGPEGADPHLLFALHPEFPMLHHRAHVIDAQLRYTHDASASLPPNAMALLRREDARVAAVLTGAHGQRQVIDSLDVGTSYQHPWLGYTFALTQYHPKARIVREMTNRSNDVRAETLHLVAQVGERTEEAWISLRESVEFDLGGEPVVVEYRPAQRELPVTIKLSDFRKLMYPGSQMAAGFESDVQLTDAQRGLILMRKISMNKPLKYRGFSFFQSSYVEGPVETTVLSVRNDPGTPLVYAGFLIVIGGVVSLFVMRPRAAHVRPSRRRVGVAS